MSAAVKIVLLAVAFLAGSVAGIKWHAGQDAIAEQARQQLVIQQEARNRAAERRQQVDVTEALNHAQKRSQAAQVAADTADAAAGRLRGDVADLQRRLPGATLDACRADAAALGAVFNACTAEYRAVARDAQGHAGDTLTLEQAWPQGAEP